MTSDHAPIAFLRNVPVRRIIRALEHEAVVSWNARGVNAFTSIRMVGVWLSITTAQMIPSRRM